MSTEEEDCKQADNKDTSEKEVPSPIKSTSLKRFVKQQSDMRAGGKAVDELHHHLEFAAKRIWLEASKHAEEDDRKTVKQRDVQRAIDKYLEPHNAIKRTVEKIEAMKQSLEGQVEQSVVHAEDRYDG